ncbi:uncharacterized protein LOC125035400 isoform X2 [Penaeus chinensis]|uniref:uncharacterized protein LOC125035400 isoform X2 n=1 Tax=Penaeus chinensis TaxID=139456 RepID=UPI001FB7FDA4|nr:uncharacterized protein LOC125035400 isoform X2 [Penaeus chinensis]
MPFSRCVECSHDKRKPSLERKEPRAGGSQEKGQDGSPPAKKKPFVLLPFVCEVCVQRHVTGSNSRAEEKGESVERKDPKRVRIEEDVVRGEAGRKSPEPQEQAGQGIKDQAVGVKGVPVKAFAHQEPANPLGEGDAADSPENPLQSAKGNAMIKEIANISRGKQSGETSGLRAKGKPGEIQVESADSTAPDAASSVVLAADPDLPDPPETSTSKVACGPVLTRIRDSICPGHAVRTLPKSLYFSRSESGVQVLTRVELRPDVAFGPVAGPFAAPPSPARRRQRWECHELDVLRQENLRQGPCQSPVLLHSRQDVLPSQPSGPKEFRIDPTTQ